MPFTGQLLAIGMIVGLLWFLASRSAAERQQAEAFARNEELFRLQRAELAASEIGHALSELSRDHRGYLLTGDESYKARYSADSIDFESNAARLLEEARSVTVEMDLAEMRERLAAWRDSAVAPNLAMRRERGLAAFDGRGPGALRFLRSAVFMDSALAAHTRMMRDLQDDAQATTILVDEAATRDDLTTFLTSTGGLVVLLLLLNLLMRLVALAFGQVTTAARAIEAGAYGNARLPDHATAPNREMALLARTFEQLAASTERRELQLQDDVERLKELERLKGDFVSTVSHELRTPLTSMRGALGLILGGKSGELPAKTKDLLQIAMTNTERLIRLINDILDVEKMDAGGVALRREPLRLRPLIEATITGLDAFAREHATTITITSGPLDADIVGDPDRLIQVFTNLLSNAVKFSPQGGSVDVSVEPADDGVMVRVRDHGPGIPPEFAERIFGRFQQAGDAGQRRSGGTGLGLNIARGLIERHGGRIGFAAAEGGGTVFWVRLPALAVRADGTPGDGDPRRSVLIVEDDASMRDVLIALVEPIARPIAVSSGEEAFVTLERESVSAIVLDLALPGMDGFTFSKQLRQHPTLRRMPVLLFSAREYSPEDLRAAGIRAADAYVKTRDSEAVLFERLRKEIAAAR